MPSNPKLYIPNQVRFLTISLQRGLPFLPNIFIKNILLSFMAKALDLFHVTMCSFLVMGNHIHFINIVQDPKDYASFLDYFKTGTAHALNRLMDIPRGSVWVKGSDSPVILDLECLIDKLVYIFANPAKAGVVNSIYEYANLNTFNVLKSKNGIITLKAFNLKRSEVPTVNKEKECKIYDYYKKLYNIVFGRKKEEFTIKVSLKAAYEALSHTSELTYDEFVNEIIERLKRAEKDFFEKRVEEKKPLLEHVKSLFVNYIPRRERSYKMICLAKDVDLRKEFIERFKYLVFLAREAYQEWKKNNTIKYYPIGFFLPPHPPLGNRTSIFT